MRAAKNVSMMRYLSVCSGIEAATVAWHPLSWTPAGFAEIEPFPRAVLEQRHGAVAVDWDYRCPLGDGQEGPSIAPQNFVPLFGDFTQIGPEHVGPVDLLVGGTPCQSFSKAGKRLGLDDPRGNLAIEFLALAKRIRARWLVWENVPGVYSSWSGEPDNEATAEWTETADFAEFLNLFRECGYRGAWRTIDAQFVRADGFDRAVPQRRRRCFLVGHSGNDARAVPVLFDPESLRGIAEPRRTTGQGTSATLGSDPEGDCGDGWHDGPGSGLISGTVTSKWAKGSSGPSGDECQNLVAVPFDTTQITSRANHSNPQPGDPCHTLAASAHPPHIAYAFAETANTLTASTGGVSRYDANGARLVAVPFSGAVAPTVTSNGNQHSGFRNGSGHVAIPEGEAPFGVPTANGWIVRRLTPRECERLQGLPDDFTAIQWRGKSAPDSLRYKAIGNSMAVNVMRWIGARIALVEQAVEEAGKANRHP